LHFEATGLAEVAKAQRRFKAAFGAVRMSDLRALLHAVTASELGSPHA
jgi:hypothetical protein